MSTARKRIVHDDDARFDRPSKRSSRARTKLRPAHADAVVGFVTAVDRGRYTLLLNEGTKAETVVIAMRARELSKDRVVVGDLVDVVGDVSGAKDTLARIVRIKDRTSVLRRTADDNDPYERIVVANADQLVIVTALANPEPRTGMIDRAAIAAYDAGMDVLLCLTKADLAPADALRDLYEPLGVKVVVIRPAADGSRDTTGSRRLCDSDIAQLFDALEGKVSVFLGHSGVGKSTLVNALVPGARRATSHVNEITGRGRHTSTSAVGLRLKRPDGSNAGWVVDTPGVRSLGLAHVEVEHVLAAFDDLAAAADSCPRGCTHLASAPDCALDDWVQDAPDSTTETTKTARLASFRRVLESRTANVGS